MNEWRGGREGDSILPGDDRCMAAPSEIWPIGTDPSATFTTSICLPRSSQSPSRLADDGESGRRWRQDNAAGSRMNCRTNTILQGVVLHPLFGPWRAGEAVMQLQRLALSCAVAKCEAQSEPIQLDGRELPSHPLDEGRDLDPPMSLGRADLSGIRGVSPVGRGPTRNSTVSAAERSLSYQRGLEQHRSQGTADIAR